MSVTRQQLRQMILDEAVELTPIEPTRPGEAFQALAAANISGQYNEKLTQFTSDLIASVGESEAARTIENLASAGMLRTLATMDTSEWEVIMTALSESANLTATQVCQLISEIADPSGHDSTLMTLGQFRRMVSEAMQAGIFGNIEKHDTGVNKGDTSRISWDINPDAKYEGGSKYDVNAFSEYIGNKYGGVDGVLDNQRLRRIMQATRTTGRVPEYVDMETKTEINPPPSGPPRDVAVEAIKAEIDKYINKKEPGKELENPNIDIPNIDIDAHNIFTHWKYFGVPIDYLDPNDVEGAWQSYTTNESTLMTVGQFRRLVREAAGGSRPVPLNEIEEVPYAAINGLLQALNRHGPWESTGKMEDAVADALTISQWVTDAADGYAKRHEVNASDLLDDLRSELNDRGSRGPGLDKVSITDYTPPDPHPSEELYQAEGSLDDDIEEISDRLDRQMGHESYQDFADELQLIRTGNMTFADRRQHLTRLELDMSTEGID